MNRKEQAEIYRLGLMLGIFKVPEVVAWCDFVSMAESSPEIAIIQASMAGSKGVNVVGHALSEVKGNFDKQSVVQQLLSIMSDRLKRDRKQAPDIARWLYIMVMTNEVPDETMAADMQRFWDAIDLAIDGIYGDVDELTDEMLDFLESYPPTASPT